MPHPRREPFCPQTEFRIALALEKIDAEHYLDFLDSLAEELALRIEDREPLSPAKEAN